MSRVKKSKGSGTHVLGVKKNSKRRRSRGGRSRNGGDADVGAVDARFKIIAKSRSKIVDARDRLSTLAKQTDARDKLNNRANSRKDNVKKITKGGITITKKKDGKISLTTAKKDEKKNVEKGKTSLAQRSKTAKITKPAVTRSPAGVKARSQMRARDDSPIRQERRSPVLHHKISPERHFRTSPIGSGFRHSHDDRYSRMPQPSHQYPKLDRTVGTKIIVSNLQSSVTEEDVIELFSDVGPLKRARLLPQGYAEIVFVQRAHALKSIDIYHNRQLDGRPMKVRIFENEDRGGYNSIASSQIVDQELYTAPRGIYVDRASLQPRADYHLTDNFGGSRSSRAGYY